MRERHPQAEVWVHPECRPEVIDLADKVLSTGKMVKEAKVTEKEEVILGTEEGIIHRLNKINSHTRFYPLKANAVCKNMKKITLPKVLKSLQDMIHRIEVSPDVSRRAHGAIEKMVQL
jgi:quinolinate synthase